jgi:ligand-binding SRPBCC domain-containing protein
MSKTFEHRSLVPGSVESLQAFHEDPRALTQLSMPPMVIQILRDDRTSLISGRIAFRLWLGPLPLTWIAEHAPGPTTTSFTDRLIDGPLAHWEHQHIFEATAQGTLLVDRISLEHKPGLAGLFTRLLFDGLPLRILFMYRHWRTRRALQGGDDAAV